MRRKREKGRGGRAAGKSVLEGQAKRLAVHRQGKMETKKSEMENFCFSRIRFPRALFHLSAVAGSITIP
jgi:hypothetical protein